MANSLFFSINSLDALEISEILSQLRIATDAFYRTFMTEQPWMKGVQD